MIMINCVHMVNDKRNYNKASSKNDNVYHSYNHVMKHLFPKKCIKIEEEKHNREKILDSSYFKI